METNSTSCNPSLHIDLFETTDEMDNLQCNNHNLTHLHLDARDISWCKINNNQDLLHVPKQAH
ncbi:MAG: hypothetical protein ACK53Y_01700 [bacterium]